MDKIIRLLSFASKDEMSEYHIDVKNAYIFLKKETSEKSVDYPLFESKNKESLINH